MKRIIRSIVVVVMCLTLSLGMGLPTSLSDTSSSTVVTVQAKGSIRSSVKKAINSYYSFYKSYVKFMKKYLSGNVTLGMLSKYEKLVKKAKKVDKAFNKIKNKNLNTAELAYWMKISTKVLNMLAKLY